MTILLAVCWWSMPFKLFPGLQPAFPQFLENDPEFIAHVQDSALGDRLGWWIASKNWDAGPPDEYAYDFILFWHLALSALIYLGILGRVRSGIIRRMEGRPSTRILSPWMIRFLFLYPLLCTAIIWVYPGWDAADIGPHKVISLMVYPPLFCSLTLIALTARDQWVSTLLIRIACVLVAVLSFVGPILGGFVDILVLWGVTLTVTGWALVTSKGFIRSRM